MKNIILLISDTFRYDNLFERAKRPVRTPMLDAFAKERATEIAGFFTGSFPTIPHRTDVTTARVGWPWYGWQDLALSSKNAWPKLLRDKGYATQLICDCPHLFNARFQQTFMAAFQTRGQEGDCPLLHLNDPIKEVMPPEKTRPGASIADQLPDQHRWTNRYYQCEEDTFCYRTSKTAVRWLEENYKANPFFLWVDFFDPHEPWDPPEYLVRRYQEEYDGAAMIHPNYGRSSDYTEEELRNLWAHYAAEAELVDRSLGRIIQKLEDLQLWDDSVVVMTSDHGFSIGEHERTGKSNINAGDDRYWPIYPEVNHVPFLIAGAGVPKGACRDIIAQPADIQPTVNELAGVAVEPPDAFHGKSFAGAVQGKTETHRDSAITSGSMNWKADGVRECACTPFLTAGKWGYVPVGPDGTPQLFNLQTDPLAEKNIAADHPGQITEMQSVFLSHLEELGDTEEVQAFWKNVFASKG